MICSSMMWPSEARPAVAQRTSPGCALAWATSALKSAAVERAVPSSSTGEYITLVTGTRSRCGSNRGLPRCGLSVSGLMEEKPSV